METNPSRKNFDQAMIWISEQLRAENDLPTLRLNLMKDMLILGAEDMPKNIPPGFPRAVGIYWGEPDHYNISIGFYETLKVPSSRAIPTVKLQLSRIKQLVNKLELSDEEFNEWTEHYRSRLKDDMVFLYSQQPSEWIITNLLFDISNHIKGVFKITGEIERAVKAGDIDEGKAKKASEAAYTLYRNVTEILDIAVDIETERRSAIFLKEHFDQ
jgi:hypothetical protein